jgi:hypothetical protein
MTRPDDTLITISARRIGSGFAVSGPEIDHGDTTEIVIDPARCVRVDPLPAVLPAGWGARISATVTCSCGDQDAGVPVRDVRLCWTGPCSDGEWNARELLPCGCGNIVPQQIGGPDHVADVVVLDPGEPT